MESFERRNLNDIRENNRTVCGIVAPRKAEGKVHDKSLSQLILCKCSSALPSISLGDFLSVAVPSKHSLKYTLSVTSGFLSFFLSSPPPPPPLLFYILNFYSALILPESAQTIVLNKVTGSELCAAEFPVKSCEVMSILILPQHIVSIIEWRPKRF